jgi:hypothetical protein
MQTSEVINKIKAVLKGKVLINDPRCKVQPLNFIAALISSFSIREGRVTGISSLRHSVMELTGEKLSRGTFWERLATRKMVKLLSSVLGGLMADLCVKMKLAANILQLLGVSKIFLLDSSSFTLPKGASEAYPAPRNNVVPSALKVHALYDLFQGIVKWFDISPATLHDRNGFPPLNFLTGALIIFDLGYWDYQLFKDIITANAYFLCRVKTNAVIKVVKVVSKISKTCIGCTLNGGRLDAFRGEIVEFLGEIKISETKETFTVRVIGFWSTEDSQYHWYTTNLEVSSDVIYSLYRLRWQLELLWKSWKSFLHLDEINTANENIILSIVLAGMCAGLMSASIAVSVINTEPREKQAAFSIQKSVNMFIRIGRLLYQVICGTLVGAKNKLTTMIAVFKDELYDPNYMNRKSTMKMVQEELCRT